MGPLTGRRLRHLSKPDRERVRELLICGRCMSRVTFAQARGNVWSATVHHDPCCPSLPPEMVEAGRTDYRISEPELWQVAGWKGRADEQE